MKYVWASEWRDDVDPSLAMAHTSVVVTRDQYIVVGAATEPSLVFRLPDGGEAWVVPVEQAADLHGLTLVEEQGDELLWVADTGVNLFGGGAELDIRRVTPNGQVLQIDLGGKLRRTLESPVHAAYAESEYRPTAVAVDEARLGGTGAIWVADGYGASLIHRYAADGSYLDCITGDEGAGRFNEPHDILIDRRRETPELYVADRVNHRIQVYGLDGAFRRTVGEGFLPGPTQLAVAGTSLVVTDLLAGRVTLFDESDTFSGCLFPHPSPPPAWDDLPDGWPNARGDDGLIAPVELRSERFHTPHGVAVDEDGRIYISEFAIGGRIAVLAP